MDAGQAADTIELAIRSLLAGLRTAHPDTPPPGEAEPGTARPTGKEPTP